MTTPSRTKLADFARSQGLTYKGAYQLWTTGAIEGIRLPTGTILVNGWKNENNVPERGTSRAIIYARVSSSQNKDNLNSQAERLTKYATASGFQTVKVVKETGSGLNDARPKLLKLLQDDSWDVLVVEHKDRLTRFGFSYLELLTSKSGQRIEVVNADKAAGDTEDLMQDFVSVITSFCARLYGPRRSKRKTEQLIAQLEKEHTAVGGTDVS